jgi:hypothetical protein
MESPSPSKKAVGFNRGKIASRLAEDRAGGHRVRPEFSPQADTAPKVQLISDTDAMSINHLPTLPAREKEEQHHNQRQDQPGRDNGRIAMRIA